MQALILAAGASSRFYPYNAVHKSLITIIGKPIIEHTLEAVKKTDIKNVVIIEGRDQSISKHIGSGEKLGLNITYVVQPKPLGMGDAVLRAKKFITSDFFLLHPHHVDFSDFKELLEHKRKTRRETVLLAKKDKMLHKFGVLEIKGDKVFDIIEKPIKQKSPSNLRVIGIYLLSKDFLTTLSHTPFEHYHFEKALSQFAKEHEVRVVITNKETVSLKYPWDLLLFKNYLLKKLTQHISRTADISKDAHIIGNVYIEDGVKIMEGSYIKGICYLGENVFIGSNSLLRDGVDLEKGTKIGAYMEVKNSLIMEDTSTHSGFIGDSVIGRGCKIGAKFTSANARLDRKNVLSEIRGKKIDTGVRSLGSIVGHNARIGINVSTMPGVVIGNNSIIGPSTTVMKNVEDNTTFYTTFQEIVEKKNTDQMKAQGKLVLFDIDYTLFDTQSFKNTKLKKYSIYTEVLDTIFALKKIALLGIFSEGETEFQKTKLLKTKLNIHFLNEYVHIVEEKNQALKEILDRYKDFKLFLVDDKLNILYDAQMYIPNVYTIWIRRGIYAENQKPIKNYTPNSTVKNLRDIVPIITNA